MKWQLSKERDKKRSSRNSRQKKTSFFSKTVSSHTTSLDATTTKSTGQVDWTRRRIKIVGVVFALLWCLLLAKAAHVQIVDGQRLALVALRQHQTTELITGKRGDILDRNGNVLARSVEFRSVFIQPQDVVEPRVVAQRLSKALNMPEKQVYAALTEKRRFVWLARKLDDQTALNVKNANLPGVHLTTEYERVYPMKHLAGQLLGFVGIDDRGLEGLELAFNESLSGQGTRKMVMRDAAGRKLYLNSQEGMDGASGADLKLSLDINVQFFAEEALEKAVSKNKAKWGGCLVVEVKSGDILAWAEYPFFNPNSITASNGFIKRNKLAMDALEQGSTIKPFLLAAALEEKVITPDSTYYCEKGRWRINGVTIRDTKPYDKLPVNKILRYSSNIGMAKIGIQLGSEKYYSYLSRLGFGQKTNIQLAGESRGILRPYKQWQPIDLAATSFGQSFSATGLQVVQAYNTLANNGVKKALRLVIDKNEASFPPERIYSEEVSRQVRSMMREVVEEDGTGKQARIPGISVGGKTGTAQKVDKGGAGYGSGRVASFVGMVPIEEPEYLVFVVLDEPTLTSYGGVVAAPVFQQVALRTLAYFGHASNIQLAAFNEPIVEEISEGAALPEGVDLGGATIEAAISDLVKQTTRPKVMPKITGKSVRSAVEQLSSYGFVPVINGKGSVVVRQDPQPGAPWPDPEKNNVKCTLWLSEG
ncbi:penicillin-binding transpeptidase domain-containing protein [Desulfovibrio litoralis]|uniref:Cell division protein FtsI (Penicillin-binding protein 3) n=1 Tax=Desulfovibrio litoralis DSM 11393 TaxID=1121455 RepID=A0A1M7SLJ0_9BACT|nr:penicillin-binding transpeptidase domain-containing protein [Desulfovibrio litoralis]SHN59320.1 cell division protein FtsI (penicillin-binding protein 3) [Desulfovibrio litoralis DSM 11393]